MSLRNAPLTPLGMADDPEGFATRARKDPVELTAAHGALPPDPGGVFAELESAIHADAGVAASGFMLLDRNEDGLRLRLALIDSARHTIDAQYYIWYGDAAGDLLMKRLLDAADRGVRVRLLVDDLSTMFADSGTRRVRDCAAALVDSHPNLKVRLFNSWTRRSKAGRVAEMLGDMRRLNRRMHNKVLVVDYRATIVGGRNVGDAYMGLHSTFNFHDLDVLGIGPVARDAAAAFDTYWDSAQALPVAALKLAVPAAERAEKVEILKRRLATAPALVRFDIEPRDWLEELRALRGVLHTGTGRVFADVPEADGIRHQMREVIHDIAEPARHELLISNAYLIPTQQTIDTLRAMHGRQVRLRVLTNSLASHDVPAVNSHYKKWRESLLKSGVELYEMRHDAAIQPLVADTAPARAEFMGLHAKCMVVDREVAFIGSMNFDPRSRKTNSEMGMVIESRALAQALAQIIERDMQPANSWRVTFGETGRLQWADDRQVLMRQPARNGWQRAADLFFMVFPDHLY